MSQREVFNMFWEGQPLTSVEILCMRSFVNHGHSLTVFTYNGVQVPEGVAMEDARQVLPADRYFTFEDSPSAFTNIFRYKLLLERGGWWVDTDVFCRKRQLWMCDYYWAEEIPGQINGAVLRFPPGDPLCWRLFRLSEERSKGPLVWGRLGPHLLKKVLSGKQPSGLAGSTEDVYALHWDEAYYFWLPEFCDQVETRTRNSTFIHFWSSNLGRMRIDCRGLPPCGSFLHRLAGHDTPCSNGDLSMCRQNIQRYLESLPK
jgi:hypothetical protein